MKIAATLLLAATATAQAPREQDLFAEDWRERNRAAAALAEADWRDLRLGELLRAAAAPIDATPTGAQWNSTVGLGGGAGGRYGFPRRRPPHEEVLSSSTQCAGVWWYSEDPVAWPGDQVEAARDLVVPWSTCELATWLIEHHVAAGATWTESLGDVPPRTPHLARCWWRSAPSDERVQQHLEHADHGSVVSSLLFRDRDRGWPHLRAAMLGGSLPARRHVLEGHAPELFDSPELVAALVEDYVDEDDDFYQQAGRLVHRLGERAIAPLVERLTGPDYRRQRALAMLCCLREHATPAVTALADNVGMDEFSTQQALVTLTACEISSEQRGVVAEAAMRAFRGTDEDVVRALACDVLGACGDAVDDEMRRELQAALLQKPGFLSAYPDEAPRLLACLYRLDAVPELPSSTRRRIARMDWATADTWLAFAADGEEVAPRLLRDVMRLPYGSIAEPLARLLVEWDPDLVARAVQKERTWGHSSTLLEALLDAAPDKLTEDDILAIALAKDVRSRVAREWLVERTGAKYARRILTETLDRWSLDETQQRLLATLDLDASERMQLLEPQLQLGSSWDLVADAAPEARRARCLEWLDACTDDSTRDRLLEHLIALDRLDDDCARICAAIEDGADIVHALRRAPRLPEPLRAFLDRRLDDGAIESDQGYWIRKVLLAHARRG